MTALKRDLLIEQGTSWSAAWMFRDKVTQDPIFSPSCTVKGQVRQRPGSPVLHEWSTAAGNASISADGVLTLSAPPTESTGWDWTYGVYDVEVTDGSTVTRVLQGSVTVSPEVTQ